MIEDVGELILKCRKEAGLSLRVLASVVGTSPHAISQYEHKGICPKVYMFEDILDACGYEIIIRKKGTKE
jgi:transcriptional regulator with XRE-family HTH domain